MPSAPRNLTAESGPGVGNITLNWTAPSSDGGEPIDKHLVCRGNASGAQGSQPVGVVDGATLTFRDTGLPNGSTWSYVVKAQNLAGLSPASNEASATTCETEVQTMPDGVQVEVCVSVGIGV